MCGVKPFQRVAPLFLLRLRGSLFAPRAGSARSGRASSAARRPAAARDPTCGGTQTGVRTLAFPRPPAARSCSASVSTRRSGRSVPARSGGWLLSPAGRSSPPPPDSLSTCNHRMLLAGRLPHQQTNCPTGGGYSIHRCRGWPIAPEPAGTGRASRVGETAARVHANADGPRRGSRPPAAGGAERARIHSRRAGGAGVKSPASGGTGPPQGIDGRRTRGRPRSQG
jgi:hypothetical protein